MTVTTISDTSLAIDPETYMPGYGVVDPSPEGYIFTGGSRITENAVNTERAICARPQ